MAIWKEAEGFSSLNDHVAQPARGYKIMNGNQPDNSFKVR
jgi:hypothetical protein